MKDKIIVIGFLLIIFAAFFINIICKDKEISTSERRKLYQFSEITSKGINGELSNNFEKYATDQFAQRESFRKIKNLFATNVFFMQDINGYFEKDGGIYKIEYPLKKTNIEKSVEKINKIYDTYLNSNMNIYYSIIPEKNYYLENDNHLKLDFKEAEKQIKNNIRKMQYIDISNSLELDDFYKTDLHWKQENLDDVFKKICEDMKLNYTWNYMKENTGKFYGTYYGQFATFKEIEPDDLYILNNEIIENCNVYNFEKKQNGNVYDRKKTKDKYDIFLSGATPIIEIANDNAIEDKELIIFRDSFGSSLAPLLIENYKKIILVDTRYINPELLEKYIKFENQDILFIYNILVLNDNLLR